MLFIVAAIFFIIWGINQTRDVLVSFLAALFLAMLAAPPLVWLQKKRVPATLAVVIVVSSIVLLLLVIGVVVGTSINSFYATLPEYQLRISQNLSAVKDFLSARDIAAPEELFSAYVDPGMVMNVTVNLLVRFSAAFSNVVLIVLTVTFILLEVMSFPIKLRSVLHDPTRAFPRFTVFAKDMQRYMIIKNLLSLATGTLVTVWLFILGVDFPILWGFLSFLLNYVPTLGSTVASIPAILLAFIQFGIVRTLVCAAGYVVINFGLDYGIEKRLMGNKLGLSTLVVFLSLLFWGSLIGPIGAVLCIPLTMSLKFAFEGSETTRWIAVLLGPADPVETKKKENAS
jgi:predicted PurR-regulated permease PerM